MWPALVTLRCSTVSRWACRPTISRSSCLGRRRASTRRLAWLSTIVTSTSATADGFDDPDASTLPSSLVVGGAAGATVAALIEYCGKVKKLANGGGGDASLRSAVHWRRDEDRLCASSDWSSCSSSLTKLIAPPTMDA